MEVLDYIAVDVSPSIKNPITEPYIATADARSALSI